MKTIDRININILKSVMEEYDIELGFSPFSKHYLKFNGIPLPHTIGYNLDFIIGYIEGFVRAALMNKMEKPKKTERTNAYIFNNLHSTIEKTHYLIKVYESFIDILGKENIPDRYMYEIKDSIAILSMYDGDTKNISFYVNDEVNEIAKALNLDWLIHLELKEDNHNE